MESLSNPHRNPHDKSISHFMDEETVIESNLSRVTQRISDVRIRAVYLVPRTGNSSYSLILAHKLCFLDEFISILKAPEGKHNIERG